jgi:hypothetical protein
MARRVYAPRSRPGRGANIRIGKAEIQDSRNRPIGSDLLAPRSQDMSGKLGFRSQPVYGSAGDIARSGTPGRRLPSAVRR